MPVDVFSNGPKTTVRGALKWARRLPQKGDFGEVTAVGASRPLPRAHLQDSADRAALAMPKAIEQWSLTSRRKKLIKTGAKVVSHGRYVTFQLAEVAISRPMFKEILMLIARLRAPPAPA